MSAAAQINNHRGAVLLVAAAAVFTLDVTVLRFLSPDVPFSQIIFFRSLSQLVLVALWIGTSKRLHYGSSRWPMLVVRGLTSLVCWWLYYASFQMLDLAVASTLTFTTSLFVVAMAPFVLGERLGWMRGLTTLIGFAGVILASGAFTLAFEPGIMIGLASSFTAAILIFQNRVLARTERTATIMFWIGLVATIGTAPAAALGWSALSAPDLGILALAGALATFGMLLTVEAYRFGEVSALAPFPYARILFALFAGYVLFSETVTLTELLGAGVIVLCGLAANERRPRAGA
ncbi:DMT family transporter [Aliishimia ponticola]|uniref:DMT family transporter n=1 Tax=Aliishimia ponticola TaxID=2499833 RepID=A0A4V3XKH1_9RHOB|nr:DMT family transporter [Aliishimia ponticola]THH36933.1 DMT family transporter [Aliishimia ponticola]